MPYAEPWSVTPSCSVTPSPVSCPGRLHWSARTPRMVVTCQHAINGQQAPGSWPVPRRSWADNTARELQQPHDRPGEQDLRTAAGYHLGLPRARSRYYARRRAPAPGRMARTRLVNDRRPPNRCGSSSRSCCCAMTTNGTGCAPRLAIEFRELLFEPVAARDDHGVDQIEYPGGQLRILFCLPVDSDHDPAEDVCGVCPAAAQVAGL